MCYGSIPNSTKFLTFLRLIDEHATEAIMGDMKPHKIVSTICNGEETLFLIKLIITF